MYPIHRFEIAFKLPHTLYYMHVRTRAAIMRVARRALVSDVLYAYVILQQAIPHVFMMLFGNRINLS